MTSIWPYYGVIARKVARWLASRSKLRDRCYVGFRNQLGVIHDERITKHTVSGSVREISTSAAHTSPRIVVMLHHGVQVLWDSDVPNLSKRFAGEISKPVAGINTGGYLLVAGDEKLVVFDIKGGEVRQVAKAECSQQVITVHSGGAPDQFFIVTKSGAVELWEMF